MHQSSRVIYYYWKRTAMYCGFSIFVLLLWNIKRLQTTVQCLNIITLNAILNVIKFTSKLRQTGERNQILENDLSRTNVTIISGIQWIIWISILPDNPFAANTKIRWKRSCISISTNRPMFVDFYTIIFVLSYAFNCIKWKIILANQRYFIRSATFYDKVV